MINTTIGKYKIARLIGEGGMASVYEAEHEMLGTKVAIKVLNPILSANAQIKERFRNEAKLMASLDHPNITKVIDFDEQPQQLSIVMEYLNGEDLKQKIKRNCPLSEKEITDVFSQTLSAFQYAHEKGIVHRDIKPSNIFILPNNHVKILDFGIAKLFGQGNEMTQTGTQMGTPIYMSPEQVKADKFIDHRSDIYSLGVTMFFAINGKPPYNSDTDSQFDIFNKIVYEPLPEFSIQSKFKDIVLKACQKNREVRYQRCDDILSELNLKGIMKSEEKTIVNNTSKSHLQHDKTVLAEKSINNYDNQSANLKAKKEPNPSRNKNKALLSFIIAIALIGIIIMVYKFRYGSDNTKPFVNSFLEQAQDTTLGDIPEQNKKYDYGDFLFYNKTSNAIKLAICYPLMAPNDWHSLGWINIAPGESAHYHSICSSPEIYYYAYSENREFSGKSEEYAFAINKAEGNFDYHLPQNPKNYQKAKFVDLTYFDRNEWPYKIEFK